MSYYPHLPCRVSQDLAAHQARFDAAQGGNREAEVRERALGLAATDSDNPVLVQSLEEACGNDDAFTAALHQLYENILMVGKHATVPAALIEAVENIALRQFRGQAEREIREEQE